MDEQLMSRRRMTHEQLEQLQLFETHCVGKATARYTPFEEFIEQILAEKELEAGRRWLMAIWILIAVVQLDEEQRHHVIEIVHHGEYIVVLDLTALRKNREKCVFCN